MPSTPLPQDIFQPAEVAKRRTSLGDFCPVATEYLMDTFADHVSFYEEWGFAKYYGDRRPDYATLAKRQAGLRKFGKPPGCVVLALKSLEARFGATGFKAAWARARKVLQDRGLLGTELQMVLRQLGWTIGYWNPNPDRNKDWDAEDRRLNPLKPGTSWNAAWRGHAERYRTVTTKGTYLGKPVDDRATLVKFGTSPPAAFRRCPDFVGTAHDGYHVFPGQGGTVIETHSMPNLLDKANIEVSPFNPLGLGGGPRWSPSVKYLSGLVAVPAKLA